MKCPNCNEVITKLYKHYITGVIKCVVCIDGWEFEAGMWEEVK